MLSTAMWNTAGSSYYPHFTDKIYKGQGEIIEIFFPELLIHMLKTNGLPIMLHF